MSPLAAPSPRQRLFSAALALAVAGLVALGLWLLARSAPAPAAPTWDHAVAEAKAGGYRLLYTQELARMLELDPAAVLLVDTRQEWEYRTGHQPGAVLFPFAPTWWERLTRGRELERVLGPDRERPVVFT